LGRPAGQARQDAATQGTVAPNRSDQKRRARYRTRRGALPPAVSAPDAPAVLAPNIPAVFWALYAVPPAVWVPDAPAVSAVAQATPPAKNALKG